MPSAQIGDHPLFYTRHRGPKAGPTLLLIHGAGGSRLVWPDPLRRMSGATVYTLDLPGHGRSPGPGYDSIVQYAEVAAAFLDAAGIERPVVVGHSMGGAVAQTLTGDTPIAGLVLIATGARLRVAPPLLEMLREIPPAAADLINRLAWSPQADPTQIEKGRHALLQTAPGVLLNDMLACDRFDGRAHLAQIQAPTLVIAGAADHLTPAKITQPLAEGIPGARLVVVEGAGHMVMLEQPAAVTKAIGQLLRRVT